MADVRQLIREAKRLEEQISQLNAKYSEHIQKIQEFFDKKQIKSLDVEPDESMNESTVLTAKKMERLTVEYIVDKLKEKLKPDIFLEVVNKEYRVNNINELIPLLKKAKIKPSDFKQYIDVIVTPNKQAIKQLYDIGEITMKDLEGCYTAKLSKSIKITEKKGDTN